MSKDTPAPVATKKPKELSIHNDIRVDNYYWLNQRENEEVIDYLKAENAYTKAQMAHTTAFQDKLFHEIVGRIKQDDSSVPYRENGYYYLTQFKEGLEYPIYSRRKGHLEATDEPLIDVNELAKGHSYYEAKDLAVSPDNTILAFGEDTVSRRIYTIRFKNLVTGEWLTDKIPNTSASAVWANDNKTIFYTVKDQSLRHFKIFKHVLGTDASEDIEVYHEEDDTFNTYILKSKSNQYLIICCFHSFATEYRILNADTPNEDFRIFQKRDLANKLEYSIAHYKDQFYVVTNWEAQNFRLMKCPEMATSMDNWTEVIAHREDVLIEGLDLFDNHMMLAERKEGLTQLRIRSEEGEEHYIEFGEDAYMAYSSVNLEFETNLVRIGYQSMSTPRTIYDYDMATKTLTLLKQDEIVGDFDPANYQTERLFAEAKDGEKIPISLVYRKGFKKNGQSPLLLYAYGSYGYSMEPFFSSLRLSLLDRGFCYAIAHIRGGEEMGRHWYENGKLLHKKNTFNDFINCAEYLLEHQYCHPEQLFAMGGSAGGLLMGVIINMRPDLWKGVIAAVPFVDVLTTMLDESIPLTTGEFAEWGNP
ncbi:MAG: S9 family peptidase, partial [Bacteroidota bacterium]